MAAGSREWRSWRSLFSFDSQRTDIGDKVENLLLAELSLKRLHEVRVPRNIDDARSQDRLAQVRLVHGRGYPGREVNGGSVNSHQGRTSSRAVGDVAVHAATFLEETLARRFHRFSRGSAVQPSVIVVRLHHDDPASHASMECSA